MRVSIPGVESLRSQLGIETDDRRVFRPILPDEAFRAARIVLSDPEIPRRMRKIGAVGIVLDLMPGHLRPSWPMICSLAGIHRDTLRTWEIEWESSCGEDLRFDLVRRTYRVIVAERASSR
jgi:hypothetical protein